MQVSKQNEIEGGDQESHEDQVKISTFIYETIRQDPKRMALIKFSPPFLKSLNLPYMMKSRNVEHQELATKLCSLLLNGDPELKIVDIVSLDVEARDIMNKKSMIRVS